MRSFIIASKSEEKADEKIRQICRENKIQEIDISAESYEKAIGIEDVRNFQKKLFLKPSAGEFKALVINAFKGITTESQNALLKILEEPPKSSFIFLIVESENILLPTIISRCKVINIKTDRTKASSHDLEDFKDIILKLSSHNIGFKLKLAQDHSTTREDAVEWLEKTILGFREILLGYAGSDPVHDLKQLAETIEKFEDGRYAVKNTNVSPRFILENTLLSI